MSLFATSVLSLAPHKKKQSVRRPSTSHVAAVRCFVPAGISNATIKRWIAQARRRLPVRPGIVSVAVVGPKEMQRLNRTWRGKNKATNVLSFELGGDKHLSSDDQWGEIVLCPVVIRREAKEQQRAYQSYFRFLLQHGLIHLLGLDHQTDREQRRWNTYERKLQV